MNSLISLHNAATTLGANTFKKVQFIEAVLTICIQRVKTIIFWKRSLQTSEDESFFKFFDANCVSKTVICFNFFYFLA